MIKYYLSVTATEQGKSADCDYYGFTTIEGMKAELCKSCDPADA